MSDGLSQMNADTQAYRLLYPVEQRWALRGPEPRDSFCLPADRRFGQGLLPISISKISKNL